MYNFTTETGLKKTKNDTVCQFTKCQNQTKFL